MKATFYTIDAEHEDGGSMAFPTLAEARKSARAEAEEGYSSTICRVTVRGPIRKVLAAVYNHTGYVRDGDSVEVERYEAGLEYDDDEGGWLPTKVRRVVLDEVERLKREKTA